jgi:hypothetical protein|tara:strand:+ start:37 stop:654 length:618 start_codon:yes stop_codon:yes gene_type:complete
MSKKLPHKFGNIPKKIWDKLEGKDKRFLFKYDYYRNKLLKINDELDDYKVITDNLKTERKQIEKRSMELWNQNKHLNENYSLNYNISFNTKYTSIKDKYGDNRGGKSTTELMKHRKVSGRYVLINVKYKGKSKSIHIGEYNSVIDRLTENKDIKSVFEIPKTLTEENIRDYISYLIEDNLYDLMYGDMLGKYNIFDRKIVFEDLL